VPRSLYCERVQRKARRPRATDTAGSCSRSWWICSVPPGILEIYCKVFILFFTFLFHHLRPRECGVPKAKSGMGRSANGVVGCCDRSAVFVSPLY